MIVASVEGNSKFIDAAAKSIFFRPVQCEGKRKKMLNTSIPINVKSIIQYLQKWALTSIGAREICFFSVEQCNLHRAKYLGAADTSFLIKVTQFYMVNSKIHTCDTSAKLFDSSIQDLVKYSYFFRLNDIILQWWTHPVQIHLTQPLLP